MNLTPLRYLLRLDAIVLLLLGVVLIFMPEQVERTFHFAGLPAAVSYILGLWGCVSVTLALGYFVAATDPIRHVVWVQIGIARGVIECVLGGLYVLHGTVSFQQARSGIILGCLIAAGYAIFYPRNSIIPTRT